MKLLDRKTIVSERADERKQTIDEGLKLARKIDSLRETSASEETRLAKFRVASLQKTKEEIDSLIEKKRSIEAEIRSLEDQRRLAQIPLDQEWEGVNTVSSLLDDTEMKLSSQLEIVKERESSLTVREKELAKEEGRVKDERVVSAKLVRESQRKLEASQLVLSESEQSRERARKYFEEENEKLLSREALIAVRERENDMMMESVSQREKEIQIRKKQLDDRYQTLQRTLNRLNIKT